MTTQSSKEELKLRRLAENTPCKYCRQLPQRQLVSLPGSYLYCLHAKGEGPDSKGLVWTPEEWIERNKKGTEKNKEDAAGDRHPFVEVTEKKIDWPGGQEILFVVHPTGEDIPTRIDTFTTREAAEKRAAQINQAANAWVAARR